MVSVKGRLEVGEILSSTNSGKFTIVADLGWNKVTIRFVETGHVTVTSRQKVANGSLKDPYFPRICGIGYIGEGEFTSRTAMYDCWKDMIRRCYEGKAPSYANCTVAVEWHNFQVFGIWYTKNYVTGLHLDKDIIVPGNTVYSPDTCKFVSQEGNNRHKKIHLQANKLYNKDLDTLESFSIQRDFCLTYNLDNSHITKVLRGKRKTHKGWSLPPEDKV